MNILTVGRPSNIANLELGSFIDKGISVETATSAIDVESILMSNSAIDTVVIGAGLDKQTRTEIVKMLLEQNQTFSIYLCAKDTGPEGLMLSIEKVIRTKD